MCSEGLYVCVFVAELTPTWTQTSQHDSAVPRVIVLLLAPAPSQTELAEPVTVSSA